MAKQLYRQKDGVRLAPYEPATGYRTEFRKDYARLIHSAAFRRLQGKTQLFPCHESDFFRNRLTHSMEVAQIAKTIATKINKEFLKSKPQIDLDIVEFAGLAHDLGHPPFGHNGEKALNDCMHDAGGFEGNAQTLRILARLEKKATYGTDDEKYYSIVKGEDRRAGLNLASRTLASIIKYDKVIKVLKKDREKPEEVNKGFYACDEEIVKSVKKLVLGSHADPDQKLKTIECQIMDIADDIAYSTYDIEDAFKSGFLSPLELISQPDEFYENLTKIVQERIDRELDYKGVTINSDEVMQILTFLLVLGKVLPAVDGAEEDINPGIAQRWSKKLASEGYLRTALTSGLVDLFVESVGFEYDVDCPAQSKIKVDADIFKMIEVIKNFTYQYVIMSPALKLTEIRGKQIVTDIFKKLDQKEGHLLLPDDFQKLYVGFAGQSVAQKRVICDFIAGMTDGYAMDFYDRLFGTKLGTVLSPF